MAYDLSITFGAEQDIDETVLWYEDQKAGLGIRFHFAVLEGFEKLKQHPQHYSFFREDYRQLILKHFPFKKNFQNRATDNYYSWRISYKQGYG